MNAAERWRSAAVALLVCSALAVPAGATTLQRASLEDLVAANSKVVVGEVLDVQSRWNDEGTFILTDVRVAPLHVVKGKVHSKEMTVTLMGGTVAGHTTLIVGGAELRPGKAYVLFLDEQNLPGSPKTLTVRDHCQGAFDLAVNRKGELRARSQAYDQVLVPGPTGASLAPGESVGFEFSGLMATLREMAGRQQREGGSHE